MTKEMLYEMAMNCATKVTYGMNGWVAFEFERTNKNGMRFFYDITFYPSGTVDFFRFNYNTKKGKGFLRRG